MSISSFEQLLQAAKTQPEPQQMLFVFTRNELPEGATAAEVEKFESGQGGSLVPVMFVDKAPAELADFSALVAESRHMGQHWDVVFVGCLAGASGQPPGDQSVQQALELMVKNIQAGLVHRFLAYRSEGDQLVFEATRYS